MLIRDKDKEALTKIFAAIPTPIEVWAYGSRINGSAHDASDLDLVLRTADLKPLDFDIYLGLLDTLKESNIPILVELRDWALLPKSFHQQIEQQYEVLFDSTKTQYLK